MNFYMPVQLYTGKDCIRTNASALSGLGSSCLIVTSSGAARKSGALDGVLQVLAERNITYALYDKITANPTVSSCMEAGRMAADLGAQLVIGIGGGSPLDAAKAAAVFAANPSLDEDSFYAKKWGSAPLPIVLVGTTAGTGSEVTNVSVLLDSKGRKHSIHDNLLYSRISFGDPAYTMTLPLSVTVSTGVDVLTHCAESYFSKKSNEISRAFSIRGINLLLPALEEAVSSDNISLDCRERLYQASILGGLAICVTGTCFPHNVGYYLTENYSVLHGIACAVFLPELLRHASVCAPEYTREFFSAINRTEAELTALVDSLLPDLELTLTPEEIEAALPRWENNGSVKNTLGTVTVDDIRRLLKNVKRTGPMSII